MAGEKLVWAASTETATAGDMMKEIKAYADLICARMQKAGLLAAAP